MPPTPVAIATPMRSRSGPPPLSPASASAWAAAATAYCVNRSVRRISLRSMYFAGSNPLISPAICVSYGEGSNRVMRPMPLRPWISASHVVATSRPSGVTAPRPVTTTRRVTATRRRRAPAVARDRDLRGTVVVGDDRAAPRKRVVDDALDLLRGKAHDRGHRTLRAARSGKPSALGHEAQGVLERENAGRDEGGELTQRVAGDETGAQGRRKRGHAARLDTIARAVAKLRVDRLDERFQDRHARRQDRRLGDRGVVEVPRWAGEANLRELVPNRPVRLVERIAGARRLLVDRASHADDLRALTRKHECEISHLRHNDSGRTSPRRGLSIIPLHSPCSEFATLPAT